MNTRDDRDIVSQLHNPPLLQPAELNEISMPPIFDRILLIDKDFGTEVRLFSENATNSLLILRPNFPTATISLSVEQFEALRSFIHPVKLHDEVERKWLIDDTSFILQTALKVEKINQGYIAVAKDGSELRVRKKGEDFYLTLKTEGDLSRGEVEITLTPEQFSKLWDSTEGGRVQKTRYTHSGTALGYEYSDTLKVEIDLFTEPILSQAEVLAEIEFASAEEAANFNPPRFFGAEVTSDKRYKTKSVARKGFPL